MSKVLYAGPQAQGWKGFEVKGAEQVYLVDYLDTLDLEARKVFLGSLMTLMVPGGRLVVVGWNWKRLVSEYQNGRMKLDEVLSRAKSPYLSHSDPDLLFYELMSVGFMGITQVDEELSPYVPKEKTLWMAFEARVPEEKDGKTV